ncbi:hypothetical protein GCM10012289_35630 [Nonomuraea cavernae]|uniref:Uncharacterized protein n=1 Tax=Nonomuraea cavernae TaxID=2045107 RepID=A0A917YZG5_9ACTN|nr:hypothetical protein GCM10012289_35630 [Nonomuraea cavernae]
MALSRGSPRVGVADHPALWSPDLPRRAFAGPTRSPGRLVRSEGYRIASDLQLGDKTKPVEWAVSSPEGDGGERRSRRVPLAASGATGTERRRVGVSAGGKCR